MVRAIIAICFAVLIAGAAMVYSQGEEPLRPTCVTDEDRVHIRAQVLLAVDEAFRDNMKHLFIGWVKDPRDQPNRASAGLQASIVAYQRARADALKWAPPNC